ncbi:MAG: TetR/AcrR family transcriptional regulator [Actinomycetota bacterium]|jgi:AcrR family transcriptional regulator
MATLREVQKQQTRQLLLDTGLELFESKGYAATTIDDIAAGAGTTRTTFYLHFASKAQLMGEVVKTVDAILTSVDDPSLSTVVELGKRDLVRTWLNRKFDQWEATRPYLHAVYQAAPMEPEVASTLEDWFRDVAADMTSGLDRANRFDPPSRKIRCVLAFGQLEYLSQRWISTGWFVDRETCLETLTDSWCHLLSED